MWGPLHEGPITLYCSPGRKFTIQDFFYNTQCCHIFDSDLQLSNRLKRHCCVFVETVVKNL